jgi:nucleoside 2-deoxyribosyltransferase
MDDRYEQRRMQIYIAAPLFSDAERRFNLEVKEFVNKLGFSTYLPQLDGGLLKDMVEKGMPLEEVKEVLFQGDVNAIKGSQIILFILDGRVPDEGGCIEIGIGFAMGKTCIGFKTDHRSFIVGEDNVMISGVLKNRVARDFDQLRDLLVNIRNNQEQQSSVLLN